MLGKHPRSHFAGDPNATAQARAEPEWWSAFGSASGPRRVWLVGASVRALASAAVRAGWEAWATDQFGDVDLCESAARYWPWKSPQHVARLAERLPPMPVAYTGALENRPRLVRVLAQRHALLGNDESALAVVRSPQVWTEVLEAHGFPVLPVCRQLPPGANPREWLEKPIASGGGRSIRWASGERAGRRCFFQKHKPGPSWGAVFVAGPRKVRLVGVTRQWLGGEVRGTHPYQYAGSSGPVVLDDCHRRGLEARASAVAAAGGLRGWFGIDLVGEPGEWCIVEINPRYPASLEVLELASGKTWWTDHVAAFLEDRDPGPKMAAASSGAAAKRILYAPTNLTAQAVLAAVDQTASTFGVSAADLPHSDVSFRPGAPMVTLLCRSSSREDVEATISEAAEYLIRRVSKCG